MAELSTQRAFYRCVRPAAALAVSAMILAAGCVDVRIPDPNVVYIAFGDSATAGPDNPDYPEILQERLGAAPNTFANDGLPGETSDAGIDRLDSLLSMDIYPNAEVLLLWEGGNDLIEFVVSVDPFLFFSPDANDYLYSEELNAMLAGVQANLEDDIARGQAAGLDVYVATYYPLASHLIRCGAMPLNILVPAQAVNGNAYVDKLNEHIRDAAAAGDATLVDIGAEGALFHADEENYYNCNHLSAQGNAIVAEIFLDALTGSGS